MQRDTKQQWFKEAKYGLFIHWGLYAILAGEYKGKRTHNIAEWILRDLEIPLAEYEALAAQFNPTEFNAEAYVQQAKKWGMRYLTITAKHHDGFALFKSNACVFNVVDATPFKRDIIGELAIACRKEEIKLCLYYSQAQDWHHPDGLVAHKDNSHRNFRRYLDEKCLPQIRELLTQYGDIGMLWFDTPISMSQSESQEIFDLVKSLQPNCIVSGRIGNDIGEYMTTGDNMIPSLPFNGDWEVPATLNNTWGYSKFDNDWKSPKDVLDLMLKINSRGGNYLLNIGPKADGSIPAQSIQILNRIGEHLRIYGHSIYATKATAHFPYERHNEIFTSKPHQLFIHLIKPCKQIYISNVGNTLVKAYFMESKEPVDIWSGLDCEGGQTWIIKLPEKYIHAESFPELGDVICIEIEEQDVMFTALV